MSDDGSRTFYTRRSNPAVQRIVRDGGPAAAATSKQLGGLEDYIGWTAEQLGDMLKAPQARPAVVKPAAANYIQYGDGVVDPTMTSIYNPTGAPGVVQDAQPHVSLQPTYDRDVASITAQMEAAGAVPTVTPIPTAAAPSPGIYAGVAEPWRAAPIDDRMPDYMTGEMADHRTTMFDFKDTVDQYEADLREFYMLRAAAQDKGEAEVVAQYDEMISKVQEDLDEAKLGLDQSMAAYRDYSVATQEEFAASVEAAAAGQEAMADAMSGLADKTEAEVAAGYDAAVADQEKLAALISSGQPVNEALTGQIIRQQEDLFREAARGTMEDIERVSQAGADMAYALSKQTMAEDEFMTEADRLTLEAQINKQLEAMQDQIAELNEQKADAIIEARAAAYDSFGPAPVMSDPYAMWDYTFGAYAEGQGWTFEESENMRGKFETLKLAGAFDRASARESITSTLFTEHLDGMIAAIKDQAPDTDLSAYSTDLEQLAMMLATGDMAGASLAQAQIYEGVFQTFGVSLALPKVETYDSIDNHEAEVNLFDVWHDHVSTWDDRSSTGYITGNLQADAYGWQGGSGADAKGKQYVGAELDELLTEAAIYAFGSKEEALRWVGSGMLQSVIERESAGYVGRVNHRAAEELDIDTWDTEAIKPYLKAAETKEFSSVGWPAGYKGQRHSATGLGQLNASNYKAFAKEFGGTDAVGNPFAEAVALLRYAKSHHGSPEQAKRVKDNTGIW